MRNYRVVCSLPGCKLAAIQPFTSVTSNVPNAGLLVELTC